MWKKVICAVVSLIFVVMGAKIWIADPFLENKTNYLTTEDYNSYVVEAYPEFDISSYTLASINPSPTGVYGELSLGYLRQRIDVATEIDSSLLCNLDLDSGWRLAEIFHYNLFTNQVVRLR